MAFENFREYKYHFTSCAGLYGMLKDYSKDNPYLTMWATHSSFMNDSSEYEYGKEMCIKVLKLYEKQAKVPSDKSIFKLGKKRIEDFLLNDAPFLISLTGNIESAAMWSMYSSGGSGIALKFDVATLQKHYLLKGKNSIDPTSCIYCKKANDILTKHGAYIELLYKTIWSFYNSDDDDNFPEVLLSDIASQIKHNSFEYEDEHRIVVSKDNRKVLYRVRDDIVIPYVEVKIPIAALKGIIVGPTANYDYIKKSIEMYIESLDWDPRVQKLSINIQKSEVPYRG
jgi:hypothetical protein